MSDADLVTGPWEPNPPARPDADPWTAPWEPNQPERPDAPPGSHAASWPDAGRTPLPTGIPEMPTHGNSESGDYWVEVDPRSFDDQYAHRGPVYTSGAQRPTIAPPPPGAAPPFPPPPQPQTPPQPPAQGYSAPAPMMDAIDALPASVVPLDDGTPAPGELKIVGRRTWKTWQLVVAVFLAAGLGMWFNGNAGTASGINSSSGSTTGGGYKLPPPSGSTATTLPASGGSPRGAAGSATTTTAAGGSTATTAGGGSTSTTAAGGAAATGSSTTTSTVVAGPATVLVPSTQQSGSWTSPAFTIAAGTWNIGWAFQCVPVPSATPTFQIFVVNSGASPGATPAVTSAAASGQSVTPQTTTGSQQLIVQTSASCRWAVKVTGFSG
jgi:hypothetical protein